MGDLTALRTQLELIHSGWRNAAAGIAQLGNAIDSASWDLELHRVNHQQRLLDFAASEAQLDRELSMAALGVYRSVASGISAVRRPCLNSARRRVRPLARAVRMKSSPSTSSMALRW